MSRTARAAVFVGPNRPFAMQEFPLRAVEADEALVRVTMSTICRSDIHSWEGKRHNPTPGILGHEIIGTIEQLGRAVGPDMRGETLREGDRVTWTEFFFCGACYYCRILDMPQKCVRLRKYGHDPSDESPHLLGGFAEYCYLLPGTGVVRLPAESGRRGGHAAELRCGHDGLGDRAGGGWHRRYGGRAGLGAAGPVRRGPRAGARRAYRDRPRHHRVSAAAWPGGLAPTSRSTLAQWTPLRSWRRCGRPVRPTGRTW